LLPSASGNVNNNPFNTSYRLNQIANFANKQITFIRHPNVRHLALSILSTYQVGI